MYLKKNLISRTPGTGRLLRILCTLLGLLLFSPFNGYAQDTVTLNLKDADVETLISTVADITGRNFVIDPRVKGKVTVISSHPMNRDEIYEVFLSILEVHGFAAIPSGDVIKVVPDIKAKTGGIPTLDGKNQTQRDQMVTQVIQVDNVNAAQLVPILRPLIPQEGHLAAYPATNVLIISDRAANVGRLARIIDRIDKVSENEIEVIPLQHASASEVVRIINNLHKGPGQQNPPQQEMDLAADERTNSILLSGERSTRLRLRTLISHLDTPLETGGNTRVVYLKYVKAKELAAILSGISGTLTPVSQQKGAPARAVSALNAEVNIQPDENTNALVITAPPDIFQSLEQVIRKLDIRRAQVLVEAIIAEVTLDKTRELGVQWVVDGSSQGSSPVGIINFNGSSGIGAIAGAVESGGIPSISDGAQIALGQYNKSVNFAALINALSNDASTNILSTPSILTLDNQEAEIIIGQNVPFITGEYSNSGSSTTSVNPFRTIQREDVGITLKVTPQINEGNSVRLEIQQEASTLSSSAAGASDLITNKRVIKTTIMVEDGHTVVLGGLIEDNLRQTAQKVPLLGDIPLLGHLFRYDKTTKVKQNMLVFLRPVILRDAAMESNITGGKYNFIRARQLEMRGLGVKLLPDKELPVLPEQLPAAGEKEGLILNPAPMDDSVFELTE